NPKESPALAFWLGTPAFAKLGAPTPLYTEAAGWNVYTESGIAMRQLEDWTLRWDLSPLGYLSTAAHGHLDALHLSVWFQGKAIVIDPGTGAYYVNKDLRTWLDSRDAHNGPSPTLWSHPVRLGSFLWSKQHDAPRWKA